MGTGSQRTLLIGSGNVATFLARNIKEPYQLTQVSGHDFVASGVKSEKLKVKNQGDNNNETNLDLSLLAFHFSLIIIAVSDKAIASVARKIGETDALVVHTSGSMPMDVLPQSRRGVLYPLQTISKKRSLDRARVPLYIEASQPVDLDLLRQLAQNIGSTATPMDSERRRYLHLAAVFCCNFVNRLYGISADILSEHGIPFQAMLPLIQETADKVAHLSPREAQTGPAVRWDTEVMEKQKSLLDDEQADIYELLSRSIHNDKLRLNKD